MPDDSDLVDLVVDLLPRRSRLHTRVSSTTCDASTSAGDHRPHRVLSSTRRQVVRDAGHPPSAPRIVVHHIISTAKNFGEIAQLRRCPSRNRSGQIDRVIDGGSRPTSSQWRTSTT
jgi:hypothetical protein